MSTLFARIRELLRVSVSVPFYTQKLNAVGITTEFLDNCDDADLMSAFYCLSTTTKEEIRKAPYQLLSSTDNIVYRGATSGTTGEAFVFFRDGVWNNKRLARLNKFLSWWGIDEQVAIANVNSRLFPLRYQDYSLIGGIDHFFLQSLNLITRKTVALRGYPSRLCEVALIAKNKIDFSQVKAIICTGEPLFSHQKQLLMEIFDCPIITEYGSQECGLYGFTCPLCHHLHINEEECLIEVKNNRLLVTDLYSHQMPIIRYYNGDLVNIEQNNYCPHGKINLTILGREGDNFAADKSMYPIKGVEYYRSISTRDDKKLVGYLNKVNSAKIDQYFAQEVNQIFANNSSLLIQKFISSIDLYKATMPPMQDKFFSDFFSFKITNYPQFFLDVMKGDRWIYYNLPHIIVDQSACLLDNHQCAIEDQIKLDKTYLIVNILANKIDFINNSLNTIFEKYLKLNHLSLIYIHLLTISLFTNNINLLNSLQINQPIEKTFVDHLDYQLIIKLISFGIANMRKQKNPPLINKLNPLLPLFISDLDLCVKYRINSLPSILAHWINILNNTSINYYEDKLPSELKTRELIFKTKQHTVVSFDNLNILDISELKEIIIQVALFNLPIDCDVLLHIINKKQKLTNNKELTKTIAFIPFMSYFAKLFFQKKEREKAYNCLLMSENISSLNSNFDSISRLYNFKQKVF